MFQSSCVKTWAQDANYSGGRRVRLFEETLPLGCESIERKLSPGILWRWPRAASQSSSCRRLALPPFRLSTFCRRTCIRTDSSPGCCTRWETIINILTRNTIALQKQFKKIGAHLNMKMKSMRRAKNTATLSIVRSMTTSCRRRLGRNRTNLRILCDSKKPEWRN